MLLTSIKLLALSPGFQALGLDALPHVLLCIQSCLVDLHEVDLARVISHHGGIELFTYLIDSTGVDSRLVDDETVGDPQFGLGRVICDFEKLQLVDQICTVGQARFLAVVDQYGLVDSHRHLPQMTKWMQQAVANGHVPVAKWLFERSRARVRVAFPSLSEASRRGYLEICQWTLCDTGRHEPLSELQWQKLETHAVASGNPLLVELICSQNPQKCLKQAVQKGFVEIVELLWTKCAPKCCVWCLMALALDSKQFAVFQWLDTKAKQRGSVARQPPLVQACCVDTLGTTSAIHQFLQSLYKDSLVDSTRWSSLSSSSSSCQLDPTCQTTFDEMAEQVVVEAFQWLRQRFPNHQFLSCQMILHAARGGNLALIRWLDSQLEQDTLDQPERDSRSLGFSNDLLTEAIFQAATHGHLETLKWLVAKQRRNNQLTKSTRPTSVMNGTLDERWQQAAEQAASQGFLQVVKWLDSEKRVLTHSLDATALHGHLETTQYLVQRHVSFSTDIFGELVAAGRVRILKLLCQHKRINKPHAKTLLSIAIDRGDLELIAFLVPLCGFHHNDSVNSSMESFDSEEDQAVLEATRRAAARNQFRVIRWLLAHGVPMARGDVDVLLDCAMEAGKLSMVKFLLQECCSLVAPSESCIANMMFDAAAQGLLYALQFLLKRFPEMDCEIPSQAMELAAAAGHFQVVRYLKSTGAQVLA